MQYKSTTKNYNISQYIAIYCINYKEFQEFQKLQSITTNYTLLQRFTIYYKE